MQGITIEGIFDLITKNFGCPVQLTETDRKLCTMRMQEFKALSKEEQRCNCLCFLRYEGCCGMHDTGKIAYLINPALETKFEITLRVHVTVENDKDTREMLLTLPPTTKLGLACTKVCNKPEGCLSFSIFDEVIV
ncbi:hypothetical protein [Halodesulfovibrio marinisediminis]|uniref:Uncharacterized protein n=1 Tax=Halodesulfovibrio marinisediminis DSM 17456 TaxID=1121457 RepID=A0A1N6I1Y6_9BACT|nr:hypothetical protein [Halodesulfovibrio marinisediminis]SIO25959.1 hypothetical protein SAMN02745161_2346 [Halodesulfovibrio marinisediminis DSM 17456]